MKKTEEKKPAATAAKKPAATKTAKPATAKKPAAKTAAKASAKTTAKKPAAKKTATRKPKPITIETICGLVEKKISKAKVSALKTDIAVDIEVWGFEDGSNHKMYIEIKDGKATVMPYPYEKKNIRISLSFANAIDFANGKLTLAKLLESKDFYAEGNVVMAIKLATIF